MLLYFSVLCISVVGASLAEWHADLLHSYHQFGVLREKVFKECSRHGGLSGRDSPNFHELFLDVDKIERFIE